MAQVIIHTNNNGGVSVTYPTSEYLETNTIEDVLAKDCPNGSIIVDSSILPTGSDAEFFDAWELSGSTITVNFSKAQSHKLAQFNALATTIAQKRQLNTLSGSPNTPDDATFIANLNAGRASISEATTTAQLVAISDPQG